MAKTNLASKALKNIKNKYGNIWIIWHNLVSQCMELETILCNINLALGQY
jgi:hypothetical protein